MSRGCTQLGVIAKPGVGGVPTEERIVRCRGSEALRPQDEIARGEAGSPCQLGVVPLPRKGRLCTGPPWSPRTLSHPSQPAFTKHLSHAWHCWCCRSKLQYQVLAFRDNNPVEETDPKSHRWL